MKTAGLKSLSITALFTLLLSVLFSANTSFAEQMDLSARRLLYNCQKKAAEYTYNLDKAGDKELFDQHVKECLEVGRTVTPPPPPAPIIAPPIAVSKAVTQLTSTAPPPHSENAPINIRDLKVAEGNDLVITGGTYFVQGGVHKYRYVYIYNGTLRFDDSAGNDTGDTDFWAKSILVANSGKLLIGAEAKPIERRNITIHLYGSDKDSDKAINCTAPDGSEICGLPNDLSQIPTGNTANPQDTFYKYDGMITDDDPNAYFGRKVLAVSYNGTLQMFGKKGVNSLQGAKKLDENVFPSGISWVRLASDISKQDVDKGVDTITLDRLVDWRSGDQIVITSTDYLPSHTELFTIDSVSTTNNNGINYSTVKLTSKVKYPHNGNKYKLTDRGIPDSILSREENGITYKRSDAETRAAVALLSRNIRIVSEGPQLGTSLPDASKCDSGNLNACDTDRYFGGHLITRQGFKSFQMQGVELYQMGQGGRMAHVPVNFFLTRTVPDATFVKDSSIWDAMNHWIELRGTQQITLQGNVGYKSIGHGFVMADGTETDNLLRANIGIYTRPGGDYRDNPRKVPGVLSRRSLNMSFREAPTGTFHWDGDKTTALTTPLSLGGDLFNPSPFFIMNAYNAFEQNMAAGAGACGSCYWFAPAEISGFSIGKTWDKMAGIQTSERPGSAPIKSFKGNFCSTAMYSLVTVGSVGTCQGFAKHPGDGDAFTDPAVTPIPNPLAEKNYTPGCNDTYVTAQKSTTKNQLDAQINTHIAKYGGDKEFCPGNPPKDVNLYKTPRISDGAFLQAQSPTSSIQCGKDKPAGCAVNVIDSYTSSFHWAETNFSAIWLRTFWFLFTDSFLSDVQNGGLTMVSGGSYDQVPTGYWGLTRRSVFVGTTQPRNDYATASGPRIYTQTPGGTFNTGDNLYCAGNVGAYCLLKHKRFNAKQELEFDDFEGISFQTSNLSGFQRLINIYDGPVYLDSVAFLDINKTDLSNPSGQNLNKCTSPKTPASFIYTAPANDVDCVKPENILTDYCKCLKNPTPGCYSAMQCNNTGYIWSDNHLFPVPVDKDHFDFLPYKASDDAFKNNNNRCILPNAAIGWKQPNGFYYPPAFHMQNLHFNNVDIRHFVLVPPFTPGTMKTDFKRLTTEYCAYMPGSFDSFTDIDRQTQINDDDGSLSGVFAPAQSLSSPKFLQYQGSIAVNNDSFYYSPNRMLECVSQQSCLQTPYDHLNLAIIPSGTYQETAITPNSGVPGVWDKECQDPTCGGALIYRQLRLDGESFGNEQGIRMMGAGISQRSIMLANHGKYYIDTTLREPNIAKKTNFTGNPGNQLKYNFFLLFAKPTTKVTFQLYLGDKTITNPKPQVTKIRVNTKKISGDNKFTGNEVATNDVITVETGKPWTDTIYNATTGVLDVTMDLSQFKSDFENTAEEACQPGSFCRWERTSCNAVQADNKDHQAICSQWATKTPECPNGGCYGFQISFPEGFDTDDAIIKQTNMRPKNDKDLYSATDQTANWPGIFDLTKGGAEAKLAYFSQNGNRMEVAFSKTTLNGTDTIQALVTIKIKPEDQQPAKFTLYQKNPQKPEFSGSSNEKLLLRSAAADFSADNLSFTGDLFH